MSRRPNGQQPTDFVAPPPLSQFFSLQLEVFMRNRFGERYLTGWMTFWIFAWLAFLSATFSLGINILGYQILWPAPLTVALFILFTLAFLAMSVVQSRERSEHSWNNGHPWRFWKTLKLDFEDDTIKRFLEPLPLLIVGAILFLYVSKFFGGYILFCTLIMTWKSHRDYNQWKNTVLDEQDSRYGSRRRSRGG